MDPLKVFYLDHLRSICVETPTSLVEGKSLDEHAHFVRHRLSEKGRLLWNQINCYVMLGIFVNFVILLVALRTLKTPSYLCESNESELLSSYAKGVSSSYDIDQTEDFFCH